MPTFLTENQPEQRELFEGYRPLITHYRKRNAISAEPPKTARRWPQPEKKKPEIPSQRRTSLPRLLPPIRKKVLVRRDKAAVFRAKVEAAIRIFAAESGSDVRLADAPPHASGVKASDSHADDQ